jgi:hypothetical protein
MGWSVDPLRHHDTTTHQTSGSPRSGIEYRFPWRQRYNRGLTTSGGARAPVCQSRAPPGPDTASEMKVGCGDDLRAARRDGCQSEGWRARLDRIPCAPPLSPAGRTSRREEITTELAPRDRNNDQGRLLLPSDVGEVIHPRGTENLLTKNQMFGSRQTAGQSPRPKSLPAYISWYINGYGRPWTSSDVSPRIGPVHGPIAGIGRALLVTTDQKASSPFLSDRRAIVNPLRVVTTIIHRRHCARRHD